MKNALFSSGIAMAALFLGFAAGPLATFSVATPEQSRSSHAFRQTLRINNVVFSPDSRTIMVQFNQTNSGPVTLGLYSPAGDKVAEKRTDGRLAGTLFFDGSDLKSGTYMLKLRKGEQYDVKAFIMVR